MADDDHPSPFDWSDFLELASQLADRSDEASHRSAVSRSYYAVFNVARQVLDRLDPDYSSHRSRDSHQQVWQRVRDLPQRQARSAERRGRSLLRERKAADYSLGGTDWSTRAKQAVERAEATLRGLRDLLD